MSYNYSNDALATTLNGDAAYDATSLTVVSGAGYPTSNFKIKISTEIIVVGTRSGVTFSGLERGHEGSPQSAHSDTDVVKHVVTAEDVGNSVTYGSMTKNTQVMSTTKQLVTWNTEIHDTGSIVDLTNDRLIVPEDGLYVVSGQIDVTNGTSAYQEIELRKNGTFFRWIYRGAQQTTSEFRPWSMTAIFEASDYLDIWASLPNSTYEQINDTSTFELLYQGAL